MKKSQRTMQLVIGFLFLFLYMFVATISAICSIDFFNLSHSMSMSICLAIAFEVGAMCSLCCGVFMKSNRTLSFGLFILLTLFQMMGNVFHSYTNLLPDFVSWIELFGLEELELIAQKRIVSIVSGAILPIVALGFIKTFVDYIDGGDNLEKNQDVNKAQDVEPSEQEETQDDIQEPVQEIETQKENKDPEPLVEENEKKKIIKDQEQPKVEQPKVEKPKVDIKPKVEQPKVEKPKVEKPKVEQSKVEKPKGIIFKNPKKNKKRKSDLYTY